MVKHKSSRHEDAGSIPELRSNPLLFYSWHKFDSSWYVYTRNMTLVHVSEPGESYCLELLPNKEREVVKAWITKQLQRK